MKKLAILISSRVQGNISHDLKGLLNSLKEHTVYPNQLEVLVKYDIDDIYVPEEFDYHMKGHYPFALGQYFGLKGRGYIDIHKGYNQLLNFIHKDVTVIGAMADDFTVEPGWDKAIWDAISGFNPYFIIHQRPHPPVERMNYSTDKFDMSYNMFYSEDMHIIDEAPLWSRALIDSVAHFPVSFTDAWTLCLEYILWMHHDIKITKFLDKVYINRRTSELDQPDNIRWSTERKTNFDYIKSDEFKKIVEIQASTIAEKVCLKTSLT